MAFGFSTSGGYGTSGARTLASKRGGFATRSPFGITPSRPGAPTPDDLTGRTKLAGTRMSELANTRTETDIDLDKRRFGANEDQRRIENERYTDLRSMLDGFKAALPPSGGGMLPGPGGESSAAAIPPRAGAGGGGDAELVRANTFGRAKANQGLAMQSALRGLQSALVDTGRAGGGLEAAAVGDLFESGLGDLAGIEGDLAENDLERAYDVEDRDVAAGLTRRGQDIQTRGQDLDLQRSNLDRVASLLAQFARGRRLY